MNPLLSAPTTDPTDIYRYRDAMYASDFLVAAVSGLDFFTWLHQRGPVAQTELARELGFHDRPVEVMLTLFASLGLLERHNGQVHLLPKATEHLVKGSPWFLGPYYPKVSDRPIAADLLAILKSGKPARFASRKDEDDWHTAMGKEEFAAEFTAMMDCRGVFLGQALAAKVDLSGCSSLLDIGGGSGIYACTFAARYPRLQATVLDKPPVDGIAARAIASRGFADRISTVAADFLQTELPGGHDAHLFSNILHDWDVPEVKRLLQSSARSLPTGGLLVIHDTFLNEHRNGPQHVAEYSVLLMHVTQGRCYGLAELRTWLEEAGFDWVQHTDTAAIRGAIVARRR